jgi:hypothetical protein
VLADKRTEDEVKRREGKWCLVRFLPATWLASDGRPRLSVDAKSSSRSEKGAVARADLRVSEAVVVAHHLRFGQVRSRRILL